MSYILQQMLLFVDESMRTVAGEDVGALGGVAIPRRLYNRFCTGVYSIKEQRLGRQTELKATKVFRKSNFRYEKSHDESAILATVREVFDCLDRHGGHVFAVWTTDVKDLSIRAEDAGMLPGPYVELVKRFSHFVQNSSQEFGQLHFDQVGTAADERAASAVQNFIVRTHTNYQSHLIQVPVYTHSVTSPGIQVADLVSYLAAGRAAAAGEERSELSEFWEAVRNLGIDYGDEPTIAPVPPKT